MAGLSRSEVDAWLKAERDSLSVQVVRIIQSEFNELRLGVAVRPPLSEHHILVVPFILAWLLDHPEHMSTCACAHCGYCELGGLGIHGLVSGYGRCFEPKSAARTHLLLTEHTQAKAAAKAAARGFVRAAASALGAVEGKLTAVGMKAPPAECLLLNQPFGHPFRGVSISILHCKKMAYHRVMDWNLAALWLAASQHSKTHAYDLIRRLSTFIVDGPGSFAIIRGPLASRGLFGVLNYLKPGKQPRMSTKSEVGSPSPAYI